MSQVRRAQATEVDEIVRLVNAAYRVEDFFVDGDRTDAAEIAGLVAAGGMLVLEDPPGVSGCVYFEIRGERGSFGYLAVDPDRQGGGRGRRLVEAVEEPCRAAGCSHLDIQVVNLREELLPYYRRLGFIEVGTRPFADLAKLKRPAHFILLSKPLARRA